MDRKITGFEKDELDDWRAVLDCGHYQHVRHNPPWTNRVWVETEIGRQSSIGRSLDCKKCDREEPSDVSLD